MNILINSINKKIYLLSIVLCLHANAFGYYNFSAVCSTGQTLYYNITSDSTVCVTYPGNIPVNGVDYWCDARQDGAGFWYCAYTYTKPDSVVNIPNWVLYDNTYYKVTGISDHAFGGCSNLQGVNLPNSIISIGEGAFCGCTSLVYLDVSDSVTTIGASAFANSGLQKIIIGESVLSIGFNALLNAPLDTIFFNAVRCLSIGNNNGSSSIGGLNGGAHLIVLGESVKHIPTMLFYYNQNIDSVIIPDSVTTIGVEAFKNCTNLTTIKMPNTIDSIGAGAFMGCTSLTNIIIPRSCSSIASSTFYGCTNLSSAIIPDNIVTVGEQAFYDCTNLDTLYIGSNVRTIGYGAFGGCYNIRYLHYNAKNCQTNFMNHPGYGGLSSSIFSYEYTYQYGGTTHDDVNTLIIGDSVLNIVDNAFGTIGYLWPNVHGITIPENVQTIGLGAFLGLTNLDTIYYNAKECREMRGNLTLPSNVRKIIVDNNVQRLPDSAFYGLTNVFDSVPWPDSIRHIGRHCYNSRGDISGKITIPSTIETINDYAFANCTGIDTIIFNAKKCMKMNSGTVFAGCDSIRYIGIGEDVRRFPDSAFTAFNHLLDTVPWRDSLQYVGAWNFPNRNELSGDFTMPQSIDTIAEGAFSNCDNILSLYTNNVKFLGGRAFANCDRLVSVTLGDSVQTLGSGTFSGCFRLNNVSLGEGITSIGDSAFGGCIRLIKPELPNSLATIGARAFDGCGDINGKLTFPASITHIGDSAYCGVGNITEIEMKGSTPPTIHAHTFEAVDSLVTVSVPCGAVLNYYITDYWENFPNIVEAPPYRLTVQSNNEVMGTATVTQQTTCSNHTATIYAVAQTGYHFLQWNDGITANPRSIPMTQDSAFTAIFVVNNSYITVHANDSTMGSVSGTGLYGYNAPVTLTATPYSGYHFLRWSDGNTQNPRYLAAVRDSSFTAIFVSNVSTITVANANPDMGNVGGSGVYYYQNLVSLTATANYGYHFVQWNDGNTQNPRTILVSQDSVFTAFFALNTYSIVATSNSTTMGSVSGGGQYTYLHEMSMTATPAYGYHFVQWNDGVTDNPRTITVTRDSAFTAQFAANSYTLTVAPNDATMGSAYGAGSYNYNTTATLTAVPNYGYHFTQWSDAVTDNPRTVTVLNNATYTAQFEINSYIITVQSSNPAIGTTSGSGSYNYLTPVNITALPNAGYHFTQWSDGNTTNPRLISVTANATYTAQFAINSYAVGVTSNNSTMGSVSGSGTYNHNSTATLTATPYYGYHFVQWQDGNTQNPRTVTVTDSAQYTAQFDYNSYLVTALSSNVTLGTATGGGSYNYLSQVALTAVPAPHYHFTMWNDSIEDNPRTITVTRDTTLTAHFAIDRHTIGVNTANATQGTASGSSTVDYNSAVWISATPNYGYHFTQWNDGNSSNPRRVVVSQDTVFTASFAPNQYTATCMANDNSRGSVTSAGGSYNYLTSVTFTAVPNANYHFLRWSNGSTDNPITFTLTQDTVLTAIFVGLTANVDDITMGTASHTKTANLVEIVTATPNYGYHFVQWQDGNTDNPRTVTLTQDTVLTAYFAVNSYHVTLGSNDSTLGIVQGSGDYDYLSQVTISATAAQHCHFVQWSDGNTTNPRLLTLTCDTVFTALFERDQQYQIVVTANDSTRGSVAGGGQYYLGEAVAIAATANEHYYFEQWSDGVTSNPRVVTVTGDATYTAVFEPVMYTLTVAANDYAMGQVAGSGSYAYGSTVTIEARAFGGYRFVGWDDGVQDGQRTVTVTADATYTALFEANVGIEDVEGETYRVYVQHGHVVVEGVEAKRVQIYDLTGRRHSTAEQLPTGVYIVRIDNRITKRVVVM